MAFFQSTDIENSTSHTSGMRQSGILCSVALLFLAQCVLSETEKTYVRPTNADCVARELGTQLGPDGTLYPSAFVMDGDSSGDGFTTTVDSNIGFRVSYFDTYKVVENTVSNKTYVLYVCGTDKPGVGAPGVSEDVMFFQIPLTSVSVPETVPFAYLEALEVVDRVHDVSTFVTAACGQKLANKCGLAAPSYVDFTDMSLNQTALKEANAATDAILLGLGQEADLVLTFDAEDAPGVLERAQWIKYLGLFFNKEKQASDIYNAIEDSYTKISSRAKKNGESQPTIAWVSHFSYDGDEHYDVSLANYKQQFIEDSHGKNVADGSAEKLVAAYPGARISAFSPTTVEFAWDGDNSFASQKEAQAAFLDFLSTVDGIIDETYSADPKTYDFNKEFGLDSVSEDVLNGLSWYKPSLVYRIDGTLSEMNGYDWFESSFVRPDLALKDVDRIVDSSRKGEAINEGEFTWLRNINENPTLLSPDSCKQLTSCSPDQIPVCPFVASCEDGGTRLLSEQPIDSDTGSCVYDTCIASVGATTDTAQMAAPAVILLTLLIVFVEALINFC